MSLLEQYIDELSKDVHVDEFSLKECQMRLPAIKHKWVGRLIRHKSELFKLNSDKDKLLSDVVKKIQSTQEYAMTIPAAEKLAIKHEWIKSINSKIRDVELIIEFLDKCEKIFHGMSFDIKNLVEIIKMETL